MLSSFLDSAIPIILMANQMDVLEPHFNHLKTIFTEAQDFQRLQKEHAQFLSTLEKKLFLNSELLQKRLELALESCTQTGQAMKEMEWDQSSWSGTERRMDFIAKVVSFVFDMARVLNCAEWDLTGL